MRKHIVLLFLVLLLFAIHPVAAGNYDRTAAVSYADQYCANPNPSYTCSGWNDCTNFTSQVLHAGGLPEVGWWQWNRAHWFFHGCGWFQHSNTWSVPSWFDDHAERTSSRYEMRSVNNLQLGDIILFRWPGDSDWGHAAVYIENQLRSQHTPNRCRVWIWYNVPSGTVVRGWHVKW